MQHLCASKCTDKSLQSRASAARLPDRTLAAGSASRVHRGLRSRALRPRGCRANAGLRTSRPRTLVCSAAGPDPRCETPMHRGALEPVERLSKMYGRVLDVISLWERAPDVRDRGPSTQMHSNVVKHEARAFAMMSVPMPRFDVTITGELNLDLILYGLPEELPPERELLAEGMMLTLGSSSGIVAHNLAAL